MKCPECPSKESIVMHANQVIIDGVACVRRRRQCKVCHFRWVTLESREKTIAEHRI